MELEEKASIEFNGYGACHFMIFNHLIYVSCYHSGNLFVINEDLSEVIQEIDGEPGKSHFHWSDVDKRMSYFLFLIWEKMRFLFFH